MRSGRALVSRAALGAMTDTVAHHSAGCTGGVDRAVEVVGVDVDGVVAAAVDGVTGMKRSALDEAFSDVRSFDDAMGEYQSTRDARVLPMYEFTCQLATLEPPPPETQQLLAAMRGNQEAMDGFVRTTAGVTSPAEFFSAENVSRIFAVAAWFWPAPTAPLLLALTASFIAACVWLAFDPAALREFISENGPVIAVSVVALSFPAAVLGLKRTALAGWMLVALGALPLLITVIGRSGPVTSLAAASVVPLIAGIAYLVSARMAPGSTTAGSQRAAAA